MYEDVVSEPLPTEFLSILEEADDRRPEEGGPDGRDPQDRTLEGSQPVEPAPVGRAVKSEP
jgi:hypothetical protein